VPPPLRDAAVAVRPQASLVETLAPRAPIPQQAVREHSGRAAPPLAAAAGPRPASIAMEPAPAAAHSPSEVELRPAELTPEPPALATPQPQPQLQPQLLVRLVAEPASAAPAVAAADPVRPAPASAAAVPMPAAPAPIEITIGRIDVRTVDAEAPPRSARAAAPRPPELPLAEYLRRRERSER
jgi:Meckel syndrome type 1 protein